MAVLKYLIFEVDVNSIQMWGSNREWHWLWGYASQLDWQHRSGRLFVGTPSNNNDSDVLSTSSWWNYMNFCFSICILLGAQRAGALDGVEHVELDEESEKLVMNDPAVQHCIASWQHLFEHAYPVYKEAMKVVTLSSKEFGSARFQLQQQVWTAHTNVIRFTIGNDACNLEGMTPRAAKLIQLLPKPEQDFGLGWCRMVELIAACTFPTDLVSLMNDGAGFLPLEIVTPEKMDEWQSIPPNSDEERQDDSIPSSQHTSYWRHLNRR